MVTIDEREDDLEWQADRLMHGAELADGTRIYSEVQLARKSRAHEQSIEDVYAEARQIPALPETVKRQILDAVWPDILKAVPVNEQLVLKAIRDGDTQAEIAELMDKSERWVRDQKLAAFKHLRQSADPYWWPWLLAVLEEVFTRSYLRRVGRL